MLSAFSTPDFVGFGFSRSANLLNGGSIIFYQVIFKEQLRNNLG